MKWSRAERLFYAETGRRIAARRVACEVPQQVLADAAGMKRANVANIDEGPGAHFGSVCGGSHVQSVEAFALCLNSPVCAR
jgi:hypothetical protein